MIKIRLITFILFFSVSALYGRDNLRIIITSNLMGGFSPSIEKQEEKDTLVAIGRSIINEKKKSNAVYIDVGNAFYPGVIAKYSFGSAVMDYFNSIGCAATVVSSLDIRLGINTLEFLRKRKGTKLLSANLQRNGKSIFKPFYILNRGKKKIALVAFTSRNILIDIAEKNVYGVELGDEDQILERTIRELKDRDVSNIILLSGLNDDINLELLKKYKDIDLIISGGDNRRGLFNKNIERIDMPRRRSLISAFDGAGYYLLDINIYNNGIEVKDYRFHGAEYGKIREQKYREFLSRLGRWKKHFRKETDKVILKGSGKEFQFDDSKLSNLLRDKYNAEVAVVMKRSINPVKTSGDMRIRDIIFSVTDNYPVFIYTLSGRQLRIINDRLKNAIFSGLQRGTIQGYAIDLGRNYKIVSTQTAFEIIERELGNPVKYKNTWENIDEIIISDLQKGKILLKDNYNYLDRRFRYTFDIFLSNFFESIKISNRDNIDIPPGKSDISYKRWGIEDRVDFTFYNRYHKFVITPYIFFVREEDDFPQNLLRGTLLYNLNFDYIVKIYHKSQVDSVVMDVDGLRPAIVRETIGGDIEESDISGKIGIGFEKQVHDPSEAAIYGVETILKLQYDLFDNLTYTFSLDSFLSFSFVNKVPENMGHIRTEIENELSFRISSNLDFSIKHKWFNYYLMESKQRYSNSRIITSLDLKTDFKIY